MSTPLQPIWLIDPIEPPTEPVLVVREIPEPLTDAIPVQLTAPGETAPRTRPAARRSVPPAPRPGRGSRNLVAVVLMLMLLLGGAADRDLGVLLRRP